MPKQFFAMSNDNVQALIELRHEIRISKIVLVIEKSFYASTYARFLLHNLSQLEKSPAFFVSMDLHQHW